jgi:two-component system, cell cycle sensor histidine kinase and response regulator CckA
VSSACPAVALAKADVLRGELFIFCTSEQEAYRIMPETEYFKKRIKALEEDLKRVEDELRHFKKMEHVGSYTGSVAHDLNNLLAGIITYPDLILMDLCEDNLLRKHIYAIKLAGEKAANIVQDLMMLTQKSPPATHTLNLNEVISDLKKSPDFKELKASHPDVKMVFNLEMPLCNIKGRSTPITKSLMNLLSNAIESIDGQGRVTMSTSNKSLDVPEMAYNQRIDRGDYVLVSIEDTGKGIAEKDIQRLFEPYYAKKVMGRSGSGLSMPVVWETIRGLKGFIKVESCEGKGTTCTLYFPVTGDNDNKERPLNEIVNCMGNGEAMLVVDDMPEQRVLACTILKKLGYSVFSVPCGEEAVEYLRDKKVDMVILDMIMDPGIDGLETYKRISEIRPDQKFLIVSGYAETERLKEIQRLGCRFCIKKPYSISEIGEVIKKGLNA